MKRRNHLEGKNERQKMCSLHWEKRLREREKVWGKVKKRDRYNVCVCVCVWERERERERVDDALQLIDFVIHQLKKIVANTTVIVKIAYRVLYKKRKYTFFSKWTNFFQIFFSESRNWEEFSVLCVVCSPLVSHTSEMSLIIFPLASLGYFFKEKGWFSPKKSKIKKTTQLKQCLQ